MILLDKYILKDGYFVTNNIKFGNSITDRFDIRTIYKPNHLNQMKIVLSQVGFIYIIFYIYSINIFIRLKIYKKII